MIKYQIIFTIDNTAKIIIPLREPIESLGPIYIEKILLLFNDQKALLSKTTIYHDMLHLADLIKKALNQKLFLDSSITTNIGLLHNQYLYDSINVPTCSLPNNSIDWPGYKYHLWSARRGLISLDSWIYNASNGSIVFEITPIYPYLFCEPEETTNYIPYEKWIKTYKPFFITTLSQETAQQWLAQAEQIIKIVEDNQKRWELQSKINVES